MATSDQTDEIDAQLDDLRARLLDPDVGEDEFARLTGLVADALGARYELQLAAHDLDGAASCLGETIECLDAALTKLPGGYSADILTDLARLYATRSGLVDSYEMQIADLDAAIGCALAALRSLPQAGGDEGETRLVLGLALLERSSAARAQGADDGAIVRSYRNDGIAALTAAMHAHPADDPAWLIAAGELGPALYDRYCDGSPSTDPDRADLDAAIDLLLDAAAADPTARTVMYLALALSDRLTVRSDASDLDRLITWCTWLLANSDSAADRCFVHELLGSAYLDRADAGPSREADLDSAIEHFQAVLASSAADDPDRGSVAARLAHAYWQRLNGDASAHDRVDKMAACSVEAWALLPADDEDRHMIGLYLVTATHEQLTRPGAAFDGAAVNRAIEVLTQIEPGFIDDERLHLIVVLELAHFLVARGQATGSTADFLTAQPWLLQSVVALPARDPSWSEQRQTLAADMAVLASLGMDADHLDGALALLEEVVSSGDDADQGRRALTRGALGTLLIQRSAYTASRADLNSGIAHLTASYDQAPAGHPYRIAAAVNLAGALLARFQELGQAEDVDAARFYLGLAAGLTGTIGAEVRSLMADVDLAVAAENGVLCLIEGMRGDGAALDKAVTSLRAALALAPPGHPHRHRIRSDLGLALVMRASAGAGGPADLAEAARELELSVAANREAHLMRPIAVLRAGGALAAAAAAANDLSVLRHAIGYVTAAYRELDPRFGARFRFEAMLGVAAMVLYRGTGDAADLDTAVKWLESATAELEDRRFHPHYANCMFALAQARRTQGRLDLGREAGFAALRGRARDLLLQSGTGRSLDFARLAAEQATQVAEWCLEDDCLPAAVEALELGRGLILHAATAVAELPALMAAAGHPELADEWQRARLLPQDSPWDEAVPGLTFLPELTAGSTELPIPADLRARTLAALAGSTAEQRLVAPPSCADIASALNATGADALVYLLGAPSGTLGPGRAVIVRAAATATAQSPPAEQIVLPELRGGQGGPLDRYRRAYAAAQAADSLGGSGRDSSDAADRAAGRDSAIGKWQRALAQLCEWAWPAVMAPTLRVATGWQLARPPRLVLIPVGELSVVPWHAARSLRADGGLARYAVHDAVISYAASGRQLCEVAQRSALTLTESPAVIGDPTGTLPGALLEARAIVHTCYPLARYLGFAQPGEVPAADGPGTPGEVLRLMPTSASAGASMLHLGCHADAGAQPGESRLVLAGHQELRVDAILRQATGRPPLAAGGLVSLAACSSDLAMSEFDEALTLATAFLAAGAVTVVGARWQLPDKTTSLLMFMFHHLMSVAGHSPREALRLAQLWLLDPARRAPPDMPAQLAEQAGRPGLEDPMVWAGIVHHGQ
jgi:tetratricopeptide (TPR) repeat protein